MPQADDFHEIRDGLYVWQTYDPAVKADLSSCGRRVGTALAFIDPIPLAARALASLCERAAPAAILLTNGNHARAAADFRERFSIPIFAHADAAAHLGLAVDHTFADGESVAGLLTAIALPGAGPGETAFHAGDMMHVGDALIHLPPYGFAPLPDKYCADAKQMRDSLGKLLRFPFEVLTFAHGLPLVTDAHQRLRRLLA
jgi:glyoxylase-like metal-dependent hydrolase (beta-lactamase superfamily II)